MQLDVALIHQVKQTSWSRDKNIDSALECLDLAALTNPTENNGVAQIHVVAVSFDAGADLSSELAGWCKNQSARRATIRAGFLLGKQFEKRQRECSRLSGSRLGATDQIFSFEKVRDGLLLNRSRLGIAGVHDGILNFTPERGKDAF